MVIKRLVVKLGSPFWEGENVTLSKVVGDLQLWDEKVTN